MTGRYIQSHTLQRPFGDDHFITTKGLDSLLIGFLSAGILMDHLFRNSAEKYLVLMGDVVETLVVMI